jgi:hypothetical membrane protein
MPKLSKSKAAAPNEPSSCLGGIVCTKSIAIIFNFILVLNGLSLVLLSAYTIRFKQANADLFSAQAYQASAYIILTSGALITSLAVVGIFSAWTEKKKLIVSYLLFLSLMILAEVSGAILALSYRTRLNETLTNDLNTVILLQYDQPGYQSQTTAFDDLQIKVGSQHSKT